jgi:hypothetical protein
MRFFRTKTQFSTRMTLRRNDCRCNRCGTATTPDSASTSWARLGVDAHHTKVDLGARGEPGPWRRRRPTDPDERLCRASTQTTTIRGVQSAAIGGGDGDRLPVLRRSCHPEEIRQNQAAERRQPVEVTGDDGLVHSRSIGNAAVGTKSRSGPPPTIWYARCGPGSVSWRRRASSRSLGDGWKTVAAQD